VLTRLEAKVEIVEVLVDFFLYFVGPKKHAIPVLVDDEVEII